MSQVISAVSSMSILYEMLGFCVLFKTLADCCRNTGCQIEEVESSSPVQAEGAFFPFTSMWSQWITVSFVQPKSTCFSGMKIELDADCVLCNVSFLVIIDTRSL